MLKSQEWLNTAPEIEILKGKYEYVLTFKEGWKKGKRNFKTKL
jgi:hypothetical protein